MLAQLQDVDFRLRPPSLENLCIFNGNSTGTLDFVPLSVDFVASVTQTGQCLGAQMRKL